MTREAFEGQLGSISPVTEQFVLKTRIIYVTCLSRKHFQVEANAENVA